MRAVVFSTGTDTMERRISSTIAWSGQSGTSMEKIRPHGVVLGNEERREDFFAFGGYCYILPIGTDRLCFWYHASTETVKPSTGVLKQLGFKRESKIRFHGLRLMMVDTRSLKPLASIPNLEVRRKSGEAPVEFVSDKVAENKRLLPRRAWETYTSVSRRYAIHRRTVGIGFSGGSWAPEPGDLGDEAI